jgi:hypothetical protein
VLYEGKGPIDPTPVYRLRKRLEEAKIRFWQPVRIDHSASIRIAVRSGFELTGALSCVKPEKPRSSNILIVRTKVNNKSLFLCTTL